MITSLHQAKRGQHLKVLSLPMESDLYGRLTAMGIGVGSGIGKAIATELPREQNI